VRTLLSPIHNHDLWTIRGTYGYKPELPAAAGIHDVVSTERADWRERAAAILGGAAPRAAVDSVGGAAAGELLSLLGEGGTLVSFGSMGSSTLELPAGDLIFKQAVVKGFWGSQVSKTMDAATRGALFGELVQRIGSGEVTLPVEAVFPFEEAGAAVEASDTAGRAENQGATTGRRFARRCGSCVNHPSSPCLADPETLGQVRWQGNCQHLAICL
ncbi:MAG: zinc-binding dehydrogenase, partial [Microbacterium sp.]|nr:zinc-binding dehydrogenase [Microbacterium sp.]